MNWNFKIVSESVVELSNFKCSFDELSRLSKIIRNIEGVFESYALENSIIAYFDPTIESPKSLKAFLDSQIIELSIKISTRPVINVPVCYEYPFCVDKEILEIELSMSFDQIIKLHSRSLYKLAMFGFVPGFFYLKGLPDQLKISRKATPNVRVPKGSVAIAHEYSGIYPTDCAGGWYVIGKTPISFLDLSKPPYLSIEAGDQFQFCSISKEEFERYDQ